MDDHEHMYSDGEMDHVAMVPPAEDHPERCLRPIPEMYPHIWHVESSVQGWIHHIYGLPTTMREPPPVYVVVRLCMHSRIWSRCTMPITRGWYIAHDMWMHVLVEWRVTTTLSSGCCR